MKPIVYLLLLLSVSAFAQDGERFLKSCASMMATNRAPQSRFFFAERREKSRLDTLTRNAQNDRFRAINYLWQRDYEQADLWLEKTSVTYPKESGAIGELYLLELRDYQRALKHFDAYDALTPAFDDIVYNSPVSYFKGLAYQGLGDHQRAIEQFSAGIDSLVHKHGAEWVNYRHFISRAVSYIALQQPEKALTDLGFALKNFNRSALAQYQRGRALRQLNRTQEAQTAFQDASFFFKALRAERTIDFQEDDHNLLYEPDIDEALQNLKTLNR